MDNVIDQKALFDMSYGMYVVCTEFSGKRNGQIANTVMQITGEPGIRIATCLNKANYTTELLGKSGLFSVSVLEQDVPMTFIGLFGFKCGREVDKFESVHSFPGEAGAPIVTDWSLSVIEAKVTQSIEMPTHVLFIGEVIGATHIKDGIPLTYSDYHLIKKGKSPKTAPTFGFNQLPR